MGDENSEFEISDVRVAFPMIEVEFTFSAPIQGFQPSLVYEFRVEDVFETSEGEITGSTDDSILYEDATGEEHEIDMSELVEEGINDG